jgi:hypothetical protein
MQEESYQCSFNANVSPGEAFEKISRVSEWWSKHYEGTSQQLGGVFTVGFPGGDRYTAKVSEMVPDQTIVWEFIDTYQAWVKNPAEWVGTSIVWDIHPLDDGVAVKMTHAGLVPALECFGQCSKSWHYLMQESLRLLLTTGKGRPV